MGPLKNTRHEAFVRAVFSGENIGPAYLAAGYTCSAKASYAAGSRLLKDVNIQARLEELKAGAATLTVLTKEWCIRRMREAVEAADRAGQHGASIRAIELLGREKGAFTEQKRVTVTSLDQIPREDIEAFLARYDGQPAPGTAPKAGRGLPN